MAGSLRVRRLHVRGQSGHHCTVSCTLLRPGSDAEKPVPGVSSNALDQLLLLWLEAAKRLAHSLTIARTLWLQYYPWSTGINIDVATQEGNKISMIVVSSWCPVQRIARPMQRHLYLTRQARRTALDDQRALRGCFYRGCSLAGWLSLIHEMGIENLLWDMLCQPETAANSLSRLQGQVQEFCAAALEYNARTASAAGLETARIISP